MKRFSQQELMKAHNLARHNASMEDAKAASEAVIVEPVDPNRKAQPFPYDEHPFGNNENNRRVAERIAREQAKLETAEPIAALSAAQAAAADLKAADAFDDGEEKELTEAEQEAAELAKLASGLDAKKAADEKARIMALPDDNPEKIALLAAEAKDKQPPAPVNAPAWRGNA